MVITVLRKMPLESPYYKLKILEGRVRRFDFSNNEDSHLQLIKM